MSPRAIDLVQAKSIADIQQLIREKAKQLGPGEWITGQGWSEYELAEQRRPLRADLDRAAPDNPVALWRAGSHSAVGNSAALRLANITAATPDPEHGVIEHDEKGEPNGVIRERTDLFRGLVPVDDQEAMKPSYLGRAGLESPSRSAGTPTKCSANFMRKRAINSLVRRFISAIRAPNGCEPFPTRLATAMTDLSSARSARPEATLEP
jgi:hypothetical protein